MYHSVAYCSTVYHILILRSVKLTRTACIHYQLNQHKKMRCVKDKGRQQRDRWKCLFSVVCGLCVCLVIYFLKNHSSPLNAAMDWKMLVNPVPHVFQHDCILGGFCHNIHIMSIIFSEEQLNTPWPVVVY